MTRSAWPLLLLPLMTGCIPSRQGMGVVALAPPSRPPASPAAAASPPSVAPERPAPRAKTAPASPAAPTAPASTAPAAPPPLPEPAARADLATGYMQLSGQACEAELKARGIPFSSAAGQAPGVEHPVRLAGPLRGVEIHEPGPREAWHRSVHEILDCRLALALDDFAAVLAEHDVAEVLQVSFYRKNARIAGRGTPSQHASGRAIDLSVVIKRDGTRLDVLRDFHGAIGDRVCGAQAAPPKQDSPAARELRSIACEAASRGIFHIILTPNFNQAHSNHFHMDIEPKRTHAEVK